MPDASVDYQASSIFGLNANFHCSASTTSTPSTNVQTMDNVGNVECERNIVDITSYTQEAGYCGADFVGDLGVILTEFGNVSDSKLVDSVTITMTKGEKATLSITGHNHDTNAHAAGLEVGHSDVSDFLPHELAEPFVAWDGFGIPENYGITVGTPASGTASSATVTFSWGSHPDEIDNVGKHFVGKNLTCKSELSMDFTGIPESNTVALLDADFAAFTNTMNGAITDSVDEADSNSAADTFAFVAHANTDLATV